MAPARLGFRCTRCGQCCRTHRVPLTDADLKRLIDATGLGEEQIVEWLSPLEIDMTGEPETFVELRAGRRLMTLAWRDDGCRFLEDDGACSVHAARPAACAAFPYALEQGSLELLPLGVCEPGWDGPADPAPWHASCEQLERELESYVERVAEHNRRQRRLRLAGRSAEERMRRPESE